MSTNYPELQLIDHILSHHTITCDNCGKVETYNAMESEEAMDVFYRDGWRGRNKCYCPKCAKKKLKNNS
jgi:hypothetical protein